MLRLTLLTSTLCLLMSPATAAAPPSIAPPTPGAIQQALERLAVGARGLYGAAHPDDENTRLLAWLVGERKLRTAYVSLTRGDGGQNLIGGELGPPLGVIRTEELRAARRIDGAEQFFTRAVDFGYSKTAEETLRIWGEEAILGDLVAVVRTFRPDVIVTRFNTDPPNHGHHTASAELARAAFEAAADPSRFPEQLRRGGGDLTPHATTRLVENKSHWRMSEGEDRSRYAQIDVGTYGPLAGRSWGEIAAASRTMHKSQGFGAAPELGPVIEYFEGVAGAPIGADPFGDLDATWARFDGTERLRERIERAIDAFDPRDPAATLPALVAIHAELKALPPDHPWRARKLDEVDALLVACAGLVVQARAPRAIAVPGEPIDAEITALARTTSDVTIKRITWPDGARDAAASELDVHRPLTRTRTLTVPEDQRYTTPFWLREAPRDGRHRVGSATDAIRPVGPPDLLVRVAFEIAGADLELVRPLRYAWVDPVHGERLEDVAVTPPVTVTPDARVTMLPNGATQRVRVRVTAHGAPRAGDVRLRAPAGWRISPDVATFAIEEPEGEQRVTFEITAPDARADPAEIAVVATVDGDTHGLRRDLIDHAHIPRRPILASASVRAVPLALEAEGRAIGYIPGAGDDVAASLRQVGYDVTILDPARLGAADLARFDAIMTGVRAYNVHRALRHHHDRLMDYVVGGGRVVVQYVVSNRFRPLEDTPIGPHPFEIARIRVTDEAADVTPIAPIHPTLERPNRLVDADWRGWVQERGLYFARTWDDRYETVIRAADAGEEPLDGAILIAPHGRGAFVYTGVSFFRQLPAGVPGAYRLLANLLAAEGR